MSNLSREQLLSRCVMIDNGDARDVQYPEGYMFMPALVKGRYETSVILHAGQKESELDEAGKYIERKNKKHPCFLGRCVCRVGDVESVNALDVEPQKSAISAFHANVIGWSNDVSRQILEAEKIAMSATYVRRMS